jgi:hypothetical protein
MDGLFMRMSRWITCALAMCACGGDYWLGGRESHSRDAGRADAGNAPNERVLNADIVLTGDQRFELARGDAGTCHLIGNGHSIRSEGTWRGHVSIQGCTVSGLGSASSAAIELETSGDAVTTLDDNLFEASGAIHVTSRDDSSVSFRNNVIADSSVVELDPSFDRSTPAFMADGTSAAPKLFQGNRIQRSLCWFGSPNWLIGGDSDAESNILAGLRAGIVLESTGLVVRRNYVHNLPYPGSGDESALSVAYGVDDALAEHNVLRRGNWVIRSFGGELRYNAILDADNSAWLNQPLEDAKIHHNLFLMCQPPVPESSDIAAGINLVNFRATGIEIYNNTLDGGGPPMRLSGAAVAIEGGCYVASFRSNLIFNFPYFRNDGGAAAIRPGPLESTAPPPARIAYADYNSFYNPDAEQIRNYGVSVPDLGVRVDPGFALHDAPSGGALDEQVEPALAGASSNCFPWQDEDILSGEVTVSFMLSSLRAAYSPAPGSRLLEAGDPSDGAGNAIGAVGDGSNAADRFGAF